jgi:MFS family permease
LTPPRLFTPAFVLLTIGHLLQALGYASMVLLPRYLVALGATRAEVGLLMAAAAVGGLLSRPGVGWALDAWGRKKTLYAGTVVMVAGMFGVGLVTEVGWVALLSRVVFGVGAGALFSGYFAFATDLVPAARRTEGLALFGIAGLAPLIISPLAERSGVDAMAVRWFLPLVGLLVAGSLPVLWFVPEHRAVAPADEVRPGVYVTLMRPSLLPVWLVNVCFSALVALFLSFALVVGEARGIEHANDLWWTYAGGAVVVRLFGATLPDRLGPSRLVPPALGSYILGVWMLSLASSWYGLLFAGLLAGIGHGYCFPILSAQAMTRTEPSLRGTTMAMFTGIWDVTKLCAPPLLGLIADAWGDAIMLRLAGLLSVLVLAIWAVMEGRVQAEQRRVDGLGRPEGALSRVV